MVVVPVRGFICRGGEVVVRSSLFRMMSSDVTHVIRVWVRKFSAFASGMRAGEQLYSCLRGTSKDVGTQ